MSNCGREATTLKPLSNKISTQHLRHRIGGFL